MTELEGYIIVGPDPKYIDQELKEEIHLYMGYSSFGRTMSEAWRRFIRPENDEELMLKRNKCVQNGWRPVPVKMRLEYTELDAG